MIYSNEKLNTLSRYKINKIKKLVVLFCIQTLGYKKRNGIPFITLSKIIGDKMGVYDGLENTITIYLQHNKTVGEFTSTLIHEYTHSLQNIVKSYNKLYKKFGYENHPMEIEARENEKKYNRKCLNFVRKNWLAKKN